jgi:DnaJ-class molecular chaperone
MQNLTEEAAKFFGISLSSKTLVADIFQAYENRPTTNTSIMCKNILLAYAISLLKKYPKAIIKVPVHFNCHHCKGTGFFPKVVDRKVEKIFICPVCAGTGKQLKAPVNNPVLTPEMAQNLYKRLFPGVRRAVVF